jgi:hypothetical protein
MAATDTTTFKKTQKPAAKTRPFRFVGGAADGAHGWGSLRSPPPYAIRCFI